MKLRGAWHRDYSEFFDTQEALLIDAMDNADSIYTVFARLQSLAVKCGYSISPKIFAGRSGERSVCERSV